MLLVTFQVLSKTEETNTKIDGSRILTCPYCGAKKEVLNLLSGNNLGQVVWSDNKTIAPMLPRVSFVQKCPQCGGYYMMSRQKNDEFSGNPSSEKGELSYQELKEAWAKLKSLPDLTQNEKTAVLMMQVWAYNDKYTRGKDIPIPDEEKTYFKIIVDDLLLLDDVDELLKRELLRETGRFEEATAPLNTFDSNNGILVEAKKKFLKCISTLDTKPFIVLGDKKDISDR